MSIKAWGSLGNGKTGFVEFNIGDRFSVVRCGRGHDIWGEHATLIRTTERHMVFKTDSGTIAKTQIDNLFATVGKASKNGYFVTMNMFENSENFYHERVSYWNSKKMCFEYK